MKANTMKTALLRIAVASLAIGVVAKPARSDNSPHHATLRGVMSPMRNMTVDDFDTLEEWGVTLVRYQMTRQFMRRGYGAGGKEGYDKWLSGKIDHLLNFVIPECRRRGMKVVVDLHDAPGGRMTDCLDWALYYDQGKLDHFFDCWRMIASRVKGNEDVVYGYDLMNEPVQTREPTTMDYWDVQAEAAKIVREIDPKTAIVIESNGWDSPRRFPELKPLPMDNVIYQAHMYGPTEYCLQGTGGREQDVAWHWPDPEKGWTRDLLRDILKDVREFEQKYDAKIYIGEFSVAAWATGGENWLRDVIAVFDEYGWDWTYHAFREWNPWSVEHEGGPDDKKMVRSADNPRKQALLKGLKGETPIDSAIQLSEERPSAATKSCRE